MEQEFRDLQNLWQQQSSKPLDTGQLIQFMNKNIRKTRFERWGMGISFLATTILLIVLGYQYGSFTTFIGLGMIIFAMAFTFLLAIRRKLPLATSEADLSNRAYLKASIQYLKDQTDMTSKYMWWYAVFLIGGLNLAQLDTIRQFGWSPLANLSLHVGASLIMFFFFYLSIRKRERQHRGELQDSLEVLQALEKQLTH